MSVLFTLLSFQTLAAQTRAKEAQSQIAQLETDLAIKQVQQGTDHPEVEKMSKMLDRLRIVEREKSQQPVTVFQLKNAKPSQTIEKTKLLFPSDLHTIVADERTSSLIFSGDSEVFKQIVPLLNDLDSEVPVKSEEQKDTTTKFVNVKVTASKAAEQHPELKPFGLHTELFQLVWKQLAQLPSCHVTPVALTGKVANHVLFLEDENDALPKQEIKVFKLQHINALEAQKIVKDLFGNDMAAISADQRTNTLVVRGQPAQLFEIEKTLMKMDEKSEEIVKNPRTELEQSNSSSKSLPDPSHKSTNDFGSPIEAHRRRISDLEKPVLQLAEKLRVSETSLGKDHRGSVKQRADLRALVQQAFVARQEVQRAELIEFTRRIKGMQQAIDARDRIAEKIVERRLEELLDPNLEWTHSEAKQQLAAPIVQYTAPNVPYTQYTVPIGQSSPSIVRSFPFTQKFSYTLFEVSDSSFMPVKVGEPIQMEAPVDFNEQLATILNKKMARVLRQDAIETTLNQRSAILVGADFEAPSPTPKPYLEPYTIIQITPREPGHFEFSWNERAPGGSINQMQLAVKSPSPGSTGYLIGLPGGSDTSSRKFLHLFIKGSADFSKNLNPNGPEPSWSFARGDSAGTGATKTELPEKLALLWELPLGGSGFESTPIIAENTVFMGDPDGRFFAIDVATGKEKWRLELETGFVASAAYIDKRIYIGDRDGVLRALDAKTGKEAWKFKAEMQIDASPNAHGDNLLVTSEDGNLYCVKRASGELLWKYETGDQLLCGASLAGNRPYLGGCDGKLHVFDVSVGKAIGEPIPLDGPTGSTPSVAGKNVFVPTYGGKLFAFDAETSKEAWQFFDPKLAQGFQNNVAIAENMVVAASRNKHVFALDATTGKIVWDIVLRKRADGSPVIAGSSVVVAAADGRLVVLDLKTGAEKWLYENKGGFIGSPAIADGKIVVASDKGTVFCFGADLR